MKKLLFISAPLILLGVILFAIADGNEALTFIGFASIIIGLIALLYTLWKRVLKKVWLWLPATLISGILSLVLCILVFVVFFFPNETARKAIQEQMSMELGRSVSIGSLSVSLLDGIQLHKLKILDKNGKKPFVQAKSLVLSYKLLPVITGQIIVSKAVLRDPEINIRRYLRNGKPATNIDDLVGPPDTSTAMAALGPIPHPRPGQQQKNTAPALPFAVHIAKMGLEGGNIRIEDTAAKNLKSSYSLDKLDIVIEDFNWPATTPLAIRFNFRIAMDEIDATGKKTGKSFTITPGIKGKVRLVKGGELKPEGTIVFFAENGSFTGQQLLNAGNSFLSNLKKSFFTGIKKEALKQIDFFETLLKKKMQQVSAGAHKKIKELTGIAAKDKKATDSSLLSKEKSALRGFEKEAKLLTGTVIREADDLIKSVDKAYKEIIKLYPGADKKMKISGYIKRARQFATAAKNNAAATIKNGRASLTGQMATLRQQAAAAFDRYAAGITGKFKAFLDQYGQKLKNGFAQELTRLEKNASKYNMNIPFMKKSFGFSRAESIIELKDGRFYFTAFRFSSKGYSLLADGWYALLGDGYNMKLTFQLPQKYNTHELLSLFKNKEGRITLTVALSSDGKKTSFKLQGKSVGERMFRVARKKAEEFIRSYISSKVSNKGLSAAFSGSSAPSGKNYNNQADSLSSSKTGALVTARKGWKTRINAEKRKIKEDMKKEAKKSLKNKSNRLLKGLKKKKLW